LNALFIMIEVINTKNIPTIRMAFSKAIVIVFITAISTVFVTGGFNVTQAQDEDQEQEQQTPSSPPAPPPPLPLPTSPLPSPASPPATVSPEEKSQMCDPSNPKLKFVNTTESKICGLPKSIKAPEVPTTTTSPPRSISPLSPRPITPP
jgi:hypothetical protein